MSALCIETLMIPVLAFWKCIAGGSQAFVHVQLPFPLDGRMVGQYQSFTDGSYALL